jgi:tripartite-type tricarboxylate transporter receptor subunit TctC
MVPKISVVAWACLLAIAASAAYGQAYPTRPIRIIDPYPAGGQGDILARIIAPRISESLGQPVVVENRPGAAGNVGAEVAAKSPPDGYTVFIGTTVALAPSRSLYAKLGYDAVKDFAPITRVGAGAYVLVVHPSLPVKSVKELVALAKARPGDLNYASAGGAGSGSHLSSELFRLRAGVKLTHVPYKGGPPAVAAVVSGETALGCMTVLAALGQINTGRMRALGVTSPQRLALLPNVPTIAESGYPGFEVTPVAGLFVPARTSRDIVVRLNTEVRKALDASDVRERFAAQGVVAGGSTPEELGAFLASEIEKWAKVIKEAGIRIE